MYEDSSRHRVHLDAENRGFPDNTTVFWLKNMFERGFIQKSFFLWVKGSVS
jgi:hypothetical protein